MYTFAFIRNAKKRDIPAKQVIRPRNNAISRDKIVVSTVISIPRRSRGCTFQYEKKIHPRRAYFVAMYLSGIFW